MTDEDALLAAIAAQPEEDTPRLAYADWLDEHDQPIRAEFIRVQVEVARVETLPRIDLNQHVQLFRRQQELLDNHREDLLIPFAWAPEHVLVDFERGFLSNITLGMDNFSHNQERLSRLVPLPRIAIADTVHRVLSLFDRADMNEIYRSIVAAIGTRPERRGARPVPQMGLIDPDSTPWPRLVELDVSGCRLGDETAARLLRAETFPSLRDLDLSANELTDAVLMPLIRTPLPRRLRKLILGGNDISDYGARLLTDNWPEDDDDRLETLNLRFTNIGTPGRQALLARFGGRVDLF